MTISRPSEIERGARVLVQTTSGEQRGTVVERWHGPMTGDSYVVALGTHMVIAPVAHVRRPSESEGSWL